jgi:hypothetical protein
MAGLLDLLWPYLIQQESGGNPNAVSRKGAFGLAQLMPDTAKDPGLGVKPFDPNVPGDNERMGKDYFSALLARYDNDPKKALAAYNWGLGNVDRWDGNPAKLPRETRGYVSTILGNASQQQPMLLGPPDKVAQATEETKANIAAAGAPPEGTAMPEQNGPDIDALLAGLLQPKQEQGGILGYLKSPKFKNWLKAMGAGLGSRPGWGPGIGAGAAIYAGMDNEEASGPDIRTILQLMQMQQSNRQHSERLGFDKEQAAAKAALESPEAKAAETTAVETAKTSAADAERAKVGDRVGKVARSLYDDISKNKDLFEQSAGPTTAYAAEAHPLNPARMIYESDTFSNQDSKSRAYASKLKQYTQSIKSELQRAYLKGTGPATEAERAEINKLIDEIPASRNLTEAQQKISTLMELMNTSFGSKLEVPALPEEPGGAGDAGSPPSGVSPEEWNALTPEERKLWN